MNRYTLEHFRQVRVRLLRRPWEMCCVTNLSDLGGSLRHWCSSDSKMSLTLEEWFEEEDDLMWNVYIFIPCSPYCAGRTNPTIFYFRHCVNDNLLCINSL